MKDVLIQLSAYPEVAEMVDYLNRTVGTGSVGTIAQALAMFDFVVRAGQEGKRLALLDDDFELYQEIIIPGRVEPRPVDPHPLDPPMGGHSADYH